MAHFNETSTVVRKMPDVEESTMDIHQPPSSMNIDGLPDEVLIKIFSYLALADLAWCSHTCKRWHCILKQKKSLWRNKECATCDMGNIQEVLAVAGAIPQLSVLYLTYSQSFRIHIAWPEARVYHHYGDAPLTWEPYFKTFDTDCLVLDHYMKKNVFFYLSWVNCENVSRIIVLEYPHIISNSVSHFVYVSNLPSSSRNCLSAGRVLGKKSDWDQSSVIEPYQQFSYSKRRRTAIQDADDNSEEENRVCSCLEEVNVLCKYIWDQHLENLCSLGPLRILHIECHRLHSLTFVRCCSSTLEVLIITDCWCLLEDAFAELCILKNLRILHLSNCRVEEATIRTYTDSLPCLESFFLNGHEAPLKNSPN